MLNAIRLTTETDLDLEAGQFPPTVDEEPEPVGVADDSDFADGCDDDEEPGPPAWEDMTVSVGPADDTLHRSVSVELAGDTRTDGCFDRKTTWRLQSFLADAGEASESPILEIGRKSRSFRPGCWQRSNIAPR